MRSVHLKGLSVVLIILAFSSCKAEKAGRPASNPQLNVELHTAASKGDIGRVKTLLNEGADPNFVYEGKSPMHWAAGWNFPEVVEYLVTHGADPNIRENEKGWTPLHWAIQKKFPDVIDVLITHKADLNITDNKGRTSLHLAVQYGDKFLVKRLIDKGADLKIRDKDGNYPEDIALELGKMGLFNVVLDKQDKMMSGKEGKKLLEAIEQFDTQTAIKLIEDGVDINIEEGFTHSKPLHKAAATGNCDVARLLISKGADVNAKAGADVTPLYQACFDLHLEMIKLLISKGANVNSPIFDGTTPLSVACDSGDSYINPQRDDEALLVIQELIKNGAKVNVITRGDSTPLHGAARQGYEKTVRFLLEHGANKNAKDKTGFTPRDVALKNNHNELAKLL